MLRVKGFSRAALLAVGLLAVSLAGGPGLAAGAREAASPEPQAVCDVTVRIMPLGDSITKGSSSGVAEENKMISYRKALWESLVGAGYNVDFVGSLTNGDFYAGFDAKHEGHAGYTAGQVATNIYNNGGENWISANPPEIILLHIGTNGLTSTSNVANVESIFNEIDQYENDTGSTVTVILARIINQVPTVNAVTTFNNAVANMAQQRIASGDLIIPVNMETGAGIIYSFWDDPINPGDMWNTGTNGLHPYYTGYNKMAPVWKTALDSLLQGCNHPPVITTNPSSQSNTENDLVSLDIDATDADSDQLTYSARNLPPGLNINPTSGLISGTISYEAYTGTPYNVMVKVTDDGQLKRSDAVSFTWTVANLNRPPALTQPSNQTSAENSSPSLQLSASDPDGDTLSYGASGLPDGLSVNPNTGLISGIVSYAAASNSPYTVTVTATDNGSPVKQASKTFTWEITNVNRPPQITSPGNQSDVEGEQISLPVTASDPDGDTLIFSATGLPIELSIHPVTGIISGFIGCQAAGSYPVIVKAADNLNPSLSAEAAFIWNVGVANCSPKVLSPGDQNSSEGTQTSLQISASDPDGPETLTFSASGLPLDLTINPASGEITGLLSYEASFTSPYDITVTATDPGGKSGSAHFQWFVQNTNRPPVLQPIPDQMSNEEDTVTLKVKASDPDQDGLQFSLHDQPPGLSIDTAQGLISGRIACGAAGSYQVTVTASDGELTDSETFAWQVLPAECVVRQVFIPVLLNRQ
jgi:Putative Ig domain/GDSL-like Lipase/Acylhydrolase